MKLFTFFGILTGLNCFVLSLICLTNAKTKLHRLLLFFNIAVAIWGFGCALAGHASTEAAALVGWKFAHLGGLFVSVLFYHIACSFCGVNRKGFLFFGYAQAIIFNFLIWFQNNLITKVRFVYDVYYNDATFLFYFAVLSYLLLVGVSFKELLNFLRNSTGINRIKTFYLIFAFLIGFLGGTSTFLPEFKLDIVYPFGNIGVIFYTLILMYAIFKYQVLDIKIAITRAIVFIFVYALILGIPIWVGFQLLGKGLWLIPMGMMGWFAIAGPFIYFYIQKRAEDRLLKEQKSYQATLRQASAGMGRIKDLKKLLNLIVFILTRAVRLEHSVIYIYNEIKKEYRIGALKRRSSKALFIEQLPIQSPLINYLNENHNSIVFEEIKQKAQDYKDDRLLSVQSVIEQLQAALIVPIYIQNRLFAFVAMGKKESDKLFSEDDLGVFTILANQAALAIENAKFYEDMKITQQQLFQAEKMATIGTMADGLSHQINNRFHALGFIAGDALDTIKISKNLEMTDQLKQVMQDLEKAFNRVQDNVVQGGEVVQGLLKYSRKGQDGFTPIDVDAVITNSYEMAQFKIKTSQMSLVRKYDLATLPKVKGNFTQLQEVFFNLIDNAYDAMMQRKNELAEEGYHPTLNIYAQAQGENLEMVFEDNGIGVKNEDNTKLFTPFFTTKLSSKKGTGLGLYVIRKIIEDNHKGTVEFSSKYKQGTRMRILLPLS